MTAYGRLATWAALEEADRADPPPKSATLFLGSSSVRLWDLKMTFPGRAATNRGFGGPHLSDVIYYVDRLVIPHRPREVVIYAGDNDIAAGKSGSESLPTCIYW